MEVAEEIKQKKEDIQSKIYLLTRLVDELASILLPVHHLQSHHGTITSDVSFIVANRAEQHVARVTATVDLK